MLMNGNEQVSEWDIWVKDFISTWINGLMEGIEKIDDEKTRKQILEISGRVCAQAHAKTLFEDTWKEVEGDMDKLFEVLNEKMGSEIYTKISEKEISVSYEKCYCPLVALGLTDSPILCNCSIYWLKENFETIFGNEVEVDINQSVLRGGKSCNLTVKRTN